MNLLKKNYVKCGLILSLITIICLGGMELTGQNQNFDKSPIGTFLTFISPGIILYFGINAKKKSQKNKLSFKQGVTEGFKISLVYAIISPFIFLIYYLFINPAIIEYLKAAYQLGNVSTNMAITVDMLAQFFSATIFGTIYAAIITFYLKTTGRKNIVIKILLGITIIVFLSSVVYGSYVQMLSTDKVERQETFGVFEGTTPCADCQGIKTTLALQENPSVFTLNLQYIGRPTTFDQKGTWTTIENAQKQTVYVLISDNPNDSKMYYLKEGDTKLTQLDAQMNPIDSPLNFTLTKKN